MSKVSFAPNANPSYSTPRSMNFLPLALFLWLSPASSPDTDFFLAQAPADPELRIEEAYKWLFHATRGGEHAIENPTTARQWLEQEWTTLSPPFPDEPLWIPLDPEGQIGRLNLRPYRERGGSPDALHAAFVAGALSFDSSPKRFRQAWTALGRALRNQPQGHLTRAEWLRLDRHMRPKGFPAIHHSAPYRTAHQPAYRVLPAAQAQPLLDALPGSH